MTRSEKNSRIRGLPPRLVLRTLDAHTGSLPSKTRIASDNRTGKYNIRFDDTNTMIFTSGTVDPATGNPPVDPTTGLFISATNEIVVGGINLSRSYMEKPIYSQILGKDLYGDASETKWESLIYLTQSVRRGVSDQFLLNTAGGQSIEPFVDFGNPASEFKADSETNQGGSFWITGSRVEDVGEGFDQPLWAKTKIEIDITPSQKCGIEMNESVEATSSINDNYMMAYWNKDASLWQGIGTGKRYYSHFVAPLSGNTGADTPTNMNEENVLKPFLEDEATTIGFHWSNGYFGVGGGGFLGFPVDLMRGRPINNFGFPFHSKFHATSSNLIPMSDYIDKPFLLEKIVLIFSGTFAFGDGRLYTSSSLLNQAANLMTTFFVLNQRDNFLFDFDVLQPMNSRSLGAENSKDWSRNFGASRFVDLETGLPINSSRDLLTYMQLSTTNTIRLDKPSPNYEALVKEWTRISNNQHDHKWSVYATLSASTKIQYEYESQAVEFCLFTDQQGSAYNEYVGYSFAQTYFNSSRNGSPNISGRGLLNELKTPAVVSSAYYSNGDRTIIIRDEQKSNNPYILHPEDNLIFGWQLPTNQYIGYFKSATEPPNADAVSVPFLTGSIFNLEFDNSVPQKVILYGSQIKEGKEYHDTLNQLLVADNVHEEIG